ncbi:MAG TPA: AraC family transcriptional regulator [Solimonas sp.]
MVAGRPAELFLVDDHIVWSSHSFTGARTSRPNCALLIGAYRPLAVTIEGQALRTRAVLVGPNVVRDVVADEAGFYSLTLDPAHPACRHLRDTVLAGRPCLDLDARLDPASVAHVRESLERDTDCAHCRAGADRLLALFFPGVAAATPIDPRIARVAAWLRREVPTRADLKTLGALCHLSAGRLTHLFTQELGVSIRSYLRWTKMSRAIELLSGERTVAEVAATIGFADSAHFCRVLRDYYAVVPSFVSDASRVRVHSCGYDGG